MKKLLLIYAFFSSTLVRADNRYVSNTGNDAANGLTAATAWKTTGRVNTAFATLSPGDSVLFRRGDTFYGSLILSRSGSGSHPIILSAYGTGAKPIITGLSKVTNWVNLGDGIYAAPVTNVKNSVNMVLKNGLVQQVGRHPNADAANGGYLTITAGTGGIAGSVCTITGPAVSSQTDWTGAELVIRIRRWNIQKQTVTAHSGSVVSYTQTSKHTPKAGFGYFFQRDSRTLDQPGEWWYDSAHGKLRMYFGTGNPSTSVVQISTVDTLIYAFKKNYITIRDLQIVGADKEGIWFQSCHDFLIKNCDFNYSGKDAATGLLSSNAAIDNCSAKNSLGSGFYMRNRSAGAQNQSVRNSTVDSTAMITGMEISGEGMGRAGITVTGNNTTIEYNTVRYSGYLGIEWWGSNVYIRNNYIHHFTMVRDDGGGIYSFENIGDFPLPPRTNRNIVSNIIMYGTGNNDGVPAALGHTNSKAVYCDNNVYNVTIDSNLAAYTNGHGFFSNSGKNIMIRHNISFENAAGFAFNRIASGDSLIRGIVVKKNVFYPYRLGYGNLFLDAPSLITPEADISALGVLDSNYYALPSGSDTSLIGTTLWSNGSHYTVAYKDFNYLQRKIGVEVHSIKIPNNGELFYNATKNSFTYSFKGLSKKGADNTIYNNSIILGPFGAAILYPNGQAAASR